MMEELELYVYSTETYLQKGLIKVGHSKLGRHKERIKEQFGTSNPEHPIILWVHSLPSGKTDRHIHAQLSKNGIDRVEDSPGQEWFKATTNDVKLAFNQVAFGSARVENYEPRREQLEAIEKARKWFFKEVPPEALKGATHPNRFLLNAKMRFGKCFTGLHVAKAVNAKNTLILTYKPEVISEWMDTANGHVAFTGCLGVRAKKKNNSAIEPTLASDGTFPAFDGQIILCVSLQDLDIDEQGNTKIRLEKLIGTDWDLVIFDEVHFGSRTDRAKHIIDSLKVKYRLDLSGTPFRLIQEDDFCSQQVYTYSYIDEQKNKREEIKNDPQEQNAKIYREMPNLHISTIEITEEDIAQQRDSFLTDDLDFSLNELFKARGNGSFVYNDAVEHFLDGLTRADHGARAISVFGKLGSQLGCPPVRHSVWWLSRVDSINALAKKLAKHPYFSKFEIINASGTGANQDDDDTMVARDKEAIERGIKKVSQDPTKVGSITLTVRRFLTGITIKEWDSILVLNDAKSPESYYQAIFRVQSAWVNRKVGKVIKPEAWIFDFAITRCLRLTYNYAEALANQLDQQDITNQQVDLNKDNLKDTVQGLCDALDIKRFYEGKLTPDSTSAKDIFEALSLDGAKASLARAITSDALVDFGALKLLEVKPEIWEVLKRIKGYRTQEVGSLEDFVQIGVEAGKIKEKKNNKEQSQEEIETENEDFVESEADREKRSRKKWYATQIKRLAICMADFIYMTYEREYNISEVINTKSSDFFKVMTGITKDEFSILCDNGFINVFTLNRIVRDFRQQETSSVAPELFIHEHLKKLVA